MFVFLYYNGRTSRASLQIATRPAILLSGEYVELPLGLFYYSKTNAEVVFELI